MKLIIGLGNPGGECLRNRHNVGHMLVDSLESIVDSLPEDIKVFKTDVFMNDSGRFVAEKVNFYKIDPKNLIIVHDDLDIALGQFKIQLGVGPKVHNGLASIEQALGTNDFWRVRIGTDNRDRVEGQKLGDSGKGYVLNDFSSEEVTVLENIFPKIWEELKKI